MSLNRSVAAVSLALLAACSSATDPGPGGGAQPAPVENLPRQLTAGEQTIVSAANDFSFGLFRNIAAAKKDSNAFTSPLSASMALGMTMNGAAGTTYDAMHSTLRFGDLSRTEVNESYKSLIELIRGLDKSTQLQIANSIWYEQTWPFRQEFLAFALSRDVLRFGDFVTKAGRRTPYFFNAGLFDDGAKLGRLAEFYARRLLLSRERGELEFDMLFGPAYKGIVLAAAVAIELARLGHNVPFAYNRKEAKDHGEGGTLVGATLAGRVLIIDDVISSRDAVDRTGPIR